MSDAIRAAVETMQSPEHSDIPLRPAVGMTLNEAVKRFYAARDFAPAWDAPELLDQLLAELRGMADDGLDPEDYGLSRLIAERPLAAKAAPARRAAFDVLATRAFIHALFHLNRGKFDPIDFDPRPVDAEDGLRRILSGIEAGDLAATFTAARPQDRIYNDLRDGLKTLRQKAAAGGWPDLPDGPSLKPGMTDPRIPLVRQRLAASGYLRADAAGGNGYDAVLEAAVREFQSDHYLEADGVVGAKTRAAMNVPIAARIDQIRVNLERLRQLTGKAATGDMVLVDIAGYRVFYMRDGAAIWGSKVVVGRSYRQTPEFMSTITHITLNPDWTVPASIFRSDMAAKIRKNLQYLTDNHLRVLNASGAEIAPASVDWNNPRGIVLRQDAGPWNALGRVAIRFANHYAVYLHDTPHRDLFDKAQRDFSSGCIRVERPFELVYLLFNAMDDASRNLIDAAAATGQKQRMDLPKPVPIMLVYWTVDVRDHGRITFRPDIYDRDEKILAHLNTRDNF